MITQIANIRHVRNISWGKTFLIAGSMAENKVESMSFINFILAFMNWTKLKFLVIDGVH